VEFSSLEMVDDNVAFHFRAFATEFGNGNESARLKGLLVHQLRRKFLRKSRFGNQALQEDSDQPQLWGLPCTIHPPSRCSESGFSEFFCEPRSLTRIQMCRGRDPLNKLQL